MSKKTLKFDNIVVNKREFHKSKQPIILDLVNVVNLINIMVMALSILLVTKKMILLNHYVLSYLEWVDTENALKTEQETCPSQLEMMIC